MVFHATAKLLSNPLSLLTQSKVRVLRAASGEKCLVFKKTVDPKIVVRSVFFSILSGIMAEKSNLFLKIRWVSNWIPVRYPNIVLMSIKINVFPLLGDIPQCP
jgi:hypothetical protein